MKNKTIGYAVLGLGIGMAHADAAHESPNAELVADLGINSLELADLILLCEERFDIEIGDDAAQKFLTVGDVAEYLEEIA